MREQILTYALRYGGSWVGIAQAIRQNESWRPSPYAGNYVTIVDDTYPCLLRQLRYPPWILFYQGDAGLLTQKGIAVVGARDHSGVGRECCRDVVRMVKDRYVVISGMAKGIDAFAHWEALDQKTIGVLGCGIDICYPKENAALYQRMRERQLLISEYPCGVKPYAAHFPWRNRLIAALADALLVVEARRKSGTMHTVNEAIALGKPVYCVVRSYLEREYLGNALLLSQGAIPLWTSEDAKEL